MNPLSMLTSDHDKVRDMFVVEYKTLSFEDKKEQCEKLTEELIVHMELEEKYFYPELRQVSETVEDQVIESLDEHEEIKNMIIGCYEAPDEANLDLTIEELEEAVVHHVGEEEQEVFPLAQDKLEDKLSKMAAEMTAYKAKAKGKMLVDKIREML